MGYASPVAAARVLTKAQRAYRRLRRARKLREWRKGRPDNVPAGPSIYDSEAAAVAAACGWNPTRKEQRAKEPPGTRWHEAYIDGGRGDELAPPGASAFWRWWSALPDEDQDDLLDLSTFSRAHGSHGEPEPLVELANKDSELAKVLVREGEDARQWGRLEE